MYFCTFTAKKVESVKKKHHVKMCKYIFTAEKKIRFW